MRTRYYAAIFAGSVAVAVFSKHVPPDLSQCELTSVTCGIPTSQGGTGPDLWSMPFPEAVGVILAGSAAIALVCVLAWLILTKLAPALIAAIFMRTWGKMVIEQRRIELAYEQRELDAAIAGANTMSVSQGSRDEAASHNHGGGRGRGRG